MVPAALTAVQLMIAAGPVDPLNRGRDGVAVRGYDVVSYFTAGKPAKGASEFSYQWMGATWRFGSAQDRDAFASSPDKYAPQFGGYCAWAVGHNYTADGDPEAWRIVDGKLYLNYNKSVQSKWEQDRGKWIEEGHRKWPGLHK
jgi:YHS domain-containing protein